MKFASLSALAAMCIQPTVLLRLCAFYTTAARVIGRKRWNLNISTARQYLAHKIRSFSHSLYPQRVSVVAQTHRSARRRQPFTTNFCRVSLRLVWLAAFFPVCFSVYAEPPKHWESTSYAYETEHSDLSHILQNFANAFGVRVEFDGQFNQSVSGKYRASSASAFLERLALEHKFQWFVFNGTLYISPREAHSVERVKVKQLSAGVLKKALSAIGLIDSRFGWGELPSEKIVLVSGPKKYVQLVQELAKGKLSAKESNPVLAFPLRYASVADRTIRYRERTITIPGVASVLTDILSSRVSKFKPNKATQAAEEEQDKPQTRAAGLEAIDKFKSLVGGSSGQSKVAADIRSNQILIHDSVDQRERYQAMIDTLDVPLHLLEISAVIIDVNRSQLQNLGVQWLFADTAEPTPSGSALVVTRLDDFLARIYALESAGDVQVTASPTVMTQENYPAVIDLSQTVHQTATGERVVQFQKVTAGTSLQVIPRLITTDNDYTKTPPDIQLVVDIEDGKLLPDRNENIVVQTSNISTQAVINAGNALVLGGFTMQSRSKQHQKVPYASDLPWVGNLFKQKKWDDSDQQRLFILIPRIVQPDVASALPKPRKRLTAPRVPNQMIVEAFTHLADGYTPAGFKTSETPEVLPCQDLREHLAFEHAQWLSNDEFNVGIALVKGSENPKNLDPSKCEGDGVLAVAFWPPLPLAKHQAGEVFIAIQKEAKRDVK